MNEVKVYSDAESLARAGAEHFLTLAREAAKARGRFNVALSGGQTPRRLYEILAGPPFRESIPWARVQIFWGDERCVPPTHPESNYRMAREALLDKIPIPQENIHRIQGELPPDQAAAAYQMELEATLGVNGRLDLILLGMGADGHTASLFPGSEAIHERARWVVAQYVEKLRAWRITLTPAAINAAANVIFLVSGVGKAESLRQALAGPYQPCILPAQLISPVDGHLLWLADTEAAALL